MPGSSSWMPYAPLGVKGFDDDLKSEDRTNKILTGNWLLPRCKNCVSTIKYSFRTVL